MKLTTLLTSSVPHIEKQTLKKRNSNRHHAKSTEIRDDLVTGLLHLLKLTRSEMTSSLLHLMKLTQNRKARQDEKDDVSTTEDERNDHASSAHSENVITQ